MLDFPNGYYQDLYRFSGLVWGNSQAVIRRYQPGGIDYIDLAGYLDAFQFLFVGLKHEKVLVRNEYRIALGAMETDYDFGAYILGQPGIGKSLFLIYALVQFLGQKQVVVLQTHPEFYLCFRESVNICSMTDTRPMCELPTVWALCDSNQSIQAPSNIFLYKPDRIRVIQTTSPKAACWKEWSDQVGAECYVMDIWSDQEIADLATLLGLDVQRMNTLARKLGNTPRTLLRFLHTEDQTIENWYRARATDAVLKCATMMCDGLRHNLPDDSPSSFYFLRPERTDTGAIVRVLSYMHVPTPMLRRLLAEALRRRNNLERLEFYNGLSQYALTRQAAASIYESWFHSFLSAGRKMQCKFIHWASNDSPYGNFYSQPPAISARNVFNPADLETTMPRTPPYYWISPYRNFPGIRSALVLEDGIFAFQTTIGSENESPIKGLQILRKRLPDNLKNVIWRVVFIGLEEDQVQYVANGWDNKIVFPDGRQVSIAWSVVDPVQNDITYRVYHDESDPVPKDFNEKLRELCEE